eukprot:15435821-Alexandrium_andersonii.AAC.1
MASFTRMVCPCICLANELLGGVVCSPLWTPWRDGKRGFPLTVREASVPWTPPSAASDLSPAL